MASGKNLDSVIGGKKSFLPLRYDSNWDDMVIKID